MEKLPKEQKMLSGTLRPSRELQGVEAGARLKKAPEPPDCLTDRAAAEWRALAPTLISLEVLTEADLRLLQLCCEALATAAELEDAIRADGYLLAAANGARKGNPCLKLLETTRNQAHRMLSDFGLSPKARKYVTKAPGPARDNPFAVFRKNHHDDDDFQPL